MKRITIAAAMAAVSFGQAAFAADAPVALTKCDKPLGSIAVVDGDTQGWTKYGLESPRGLIAAMATQSGCFTVQSAGGAPADFLFNAIAGDKEEVDKGIGLAQTALTEGLVRSGMAGSLVSRVPFGGQALGMLGGFGGKKKTIAAGLRVINPGTGQTVISGQGEQSKTSVSIGGLGDMGGYASKDGQMLASAFVIAFNNVVAQSSALASARPAAAAVTQVATKPAFTTAIDTQMYEGPAKGKTVRSLRAGSALTPTGVREGLFVEVSDAYGTKGWVSVEDLK